MTRALVFGITGQDGSYMAELLVSKGYEVHGVVRPTSSWGQSRIDRLVGAGPETGRRVSLHCADLTDNMSIVRVLEQTSPDEIYNFAAQTHVGNSFVVSEQTANTTGVGACRILEGIRVVGSRARYYQASSSEMFGRTPPPQSEHSSFTPCSPYAAAKLYAYWSTRNYREAYGMYAVNGILFNHESPRRNPEFVTRKISRAVARISAGLDRHVILGNLNAVRDWGYAPEYMECVWRMMQQEDPDDYVVATGTGYSVEDFARLAFEVVELDWADYVRLDDELCRPNEVPALIGDPSKVAEVLGWKATTFAPELARIMVSADVAMLAGSAPDGVVRFRDSLPGSREEGPHEA